MNFICPYIGRGGSLNRPGRLGQSPLPPRSEVVLPDVTTLSHRSHKSGCALLVPTVARWRQQRAHFWYSVFLTSTRGSTASASRTELTIKISSSSRSKSAQENINPSGGPHKTTSASSELPI